MDFSRLIANLDSLEQRYAVPGFDMIITRDHETVFRHMGGCSDYEKRVPVCGRELYYIFSATKVITMTAGVCSPVKQSRRAWATLGTRPP